MPTVNPLLHVLLSLGVPALLSVIAMSAVFGGIIFITAKQDIYTSVMGFAVSFMYLSLSITVDSITTIIAWVALILGLLTSIWYIIDTYV